MWWATRALPRPTILLHEMSSLARSLARSLCGVRSHDLSAKGYDIHDPPSVLQVVYTLA